MLALLLIPHFALGATTFTLSPDERAKLPFAAEDCATPGRAIPDGEVPNPLDVARDAFCAEDLQRRAAPKGFVAVYGSARDNLPALDYALTKNFANAWTRDELGKRFPIATAGGGGMMAAANQGALEAGGRSLGFPTRFGPKAVEHPSPFISKDGSGRPDSYTFSSFSQRETEMIDRSVASVFAPGGIGTQWELLETLTKIQTGKKKPGPIVLLGSEKQWGPTLASLRMLAEQLGTMKPDDISMIRLAATPEKAAEIVHDALAGQLNAGRDADSPEPSSTNAQ